MELTLLPGIKSPADVKALPIDELTTWLRGSTGYDSDTSFIRAFRKWVRNNLRRDG